MRVFRISKRAYIHDLSDTGAGLFGARWNPKGMNMLYTSGSISLASLEFLAHNYHLLSRKDIVLAEIIIAAKESMMVLSENDLPRDWNEKSYTPLSTQEIGRNFLLQSDLYILKVPSAIVPFEHNYLFNPMHQEHKSTRIKRLIDPFEIDNRIFGKQLPNE